MEQFKINAMLNDVVIKQVSMYLGWADLKTCRRLCKQWYDDCEEQWLLRGPVKELYSAETDSVGKNSIAVLLGVDWSAFAGWTGCRKYKRFLLDGFHFDDNWSNQYDFWKNRGKFITSLEIRDCSILSDNTCVALLLCESTPNLKVFKLVRVRFCSRSTSSLAPLTRVIPKKNLRHFEIQYHSVYQSLPVSWEVIFENFPDLEGLSLANYNIHNELPDVLEGLESFGAKHCNLHPLKYLNVLNTSTFDECGAMPFPMSLLDHFQAQSKKSTKNSLILRELGCGANWLKSAYLYQLIDFVAKGLTKLSIKQDCGADILEPNVPKISGGFNLPQMLHLTRLDLWDCNVRGLRFLINCPNLKQLNIIGNDILAERLGRHSFMCEWVKGWHEKERKKIFLPYLSSFHFNYQMNINGDDFEAFARWMPNLESLMIYGPAVGIEPLWKNFTKLRRLYICHSHVTDEGFTGIHVDKTELSTIILESYQRYPNLADLLELTELVVERQPIPSYVFQWPNGTPTEFSVREAFCKLPSLKKLYMSPHAITATGMAALKTEFIGTLNTTSCPNIFEFINNF